MTAVPEPRSAFDFYARRLEESAQINRETRAEIADLHADVEMLMAAHEHHVAATAVTLADYRRCLVAVLGDNLPDQHRAWIRRLLDQHPVAP